MCNLSLAGTSGINQAIRPVITTITFCQQQKSALLSNIYHKLLKQFIMVQLLWYDWNIIVNKALHHFDEIRFRKYHTVTMCNFLKKKPLTYANLHSLTRLEGTKNHSCWKFLYKLSLLTACLLLVFFWYFLSNPIISSHAICNKLKAIYLKHHNKGEPCGQDMPVHLRVFIGIVTVRGVTEISVPARPQTRNLNSFHNFKSQNFNVFIVTCWSSSR